MDDLVTDDIVQVVLHPALMPRFREWLADNRLELFTIPTHADDLPTFGICRVQGADRPGYRPERTP